MARSGDSGVGMVVPVEDVASKGHKSVVVGQLNCELMFVGLAEQVKPATRDLR